MRKLLAILLAPLFFILFLLAITLNQVTNTVTEPDVVIGMMNDGEFYDYAYDNIIANMVRDTTEKGIDIATTTLARNPPMKTSSTIATSTIPWTRAFVTVRTDFDTSSFC